MGQSAPLGRNGSAERVLVAEDECLIALEIADQVAELGYRVVGPACTMSEARHLAVTAPIDGALLDLNLNGVFSHEIADILSRRKIPFVFITGYSDRPAGAYANIDVLHKPYARIELAQAIQGMLTKSLLHGEVEGTKPRIGVSNLQKL
jgi:DNA-binding response OmpR family regulator